ncbi:MAG TPA: methionyl-tRNA formyltransferase [Burkholderiales bacterium]|nr:methionyl-tRNA formyltransferase [Burkholderiales bacterium]
MAPSHFSPLDIVFAGTPAFGVPALEALHGAGHRIRAVYTQPDRPAGRGRAITASPVKLRALELGLAVEQPATLRSREALEQLRDHAPQLMVVVAYGLILPPPVLDVPPLGCLNIHASLLPRWRGAAPIERAIEAGDRETGVSIMKMDAGLDTGPVLLARPTPIGPRETAGALHDRLARLGAEAIIEAIAAWQAGRIAPQPQPASGASYARKIARTEAALDWTRDAEALDRQVRAFNPRPVAETSWSGKQLRVWEAEALPRTIDAPPGAVIEAGARLIVAAGSGALRIVRLQLAGRRVMSAAEFQHAHSLAGERLGG